MQTGIAQKEIAVAAALLLLAGCRARVGTVNEVATFAAEEIELDAAALRQQDAVEPRPAQPSTKEVRVQAMTNGADIVFRLRWDDPTANDVSAPNRFAGGCAIPIPRQIQPEPADAQMGEEGSPVDLVLWRTDWQAAVEGREDSIRAIYTHAVDQFLREAAEWRALAAPLSRPTEAWRREVAAYSGELTDAELRRACAAAIGEASKVLYHSLFGPGGPAPPREASYRTTLQLGSMLSELAAYYRSFGYAPPQGKAIDHVAIKPTSPPL